MTNKTLIATLVLLVVAFECSTLKAQSVGRTNVPPSITVTWNVPSDPSVGSYKLYMGGASGVYTNVISIAGTAVTSTNITTLLRGSTYYFTATCVSTNGLLEGPYSNEVSVKVLSLPITVSIQASETQ
jgi:hypothetical protein